MYSKLVRLNIPSGWAITHNTFGDEDPFIQDGRIVNEQFYNENLLMIEPIEFNGTDWIVNQNRDRLKLGWYPHANPQGSYRLQIIAGNPEEEGLEFEAKEREKIRQVIEQYFHLINQGLDLQAIKWQIKQSEKTFEKNSSLPLVIRKKVQDYYRYRNRFYYGQLYSLYSPIYYELTNISYRSAKENKIAYNMPTQDNSRRG
jgi:hypothetical protein